MCLTRVVAKFSKYIESAASTAPPPGTRRPDSNTRRTAHSASCADRSISSQYASVGPRRISDAAVRATGL